MNELKEYLKRELGVSDEEYDQMVQEEAEKSQVNKNIVSLQEETEKLAGKFKTARDLYNQLDKDNCTLDELKQAKINLLNEQCEQTILSGFLSQSTGYTFGFSTYDQLNFTQQYSLMIADQSMSTVAWKTEDAGVVELTREEFTQLVSVEAVQHKLNNINKYWMKKELVMVSTDKDEVLNIVW